MLEAFLSVSNKEKPGEIIIGGEGEHIFTVPEYVSAISIVAVAPSCIYSKGVRSTNQADKDGQGGPGLSYRNDIPVNEGDVLEIVIGRQSSTRGGVSGNVMVYLLDEDGEKELVLQADGNNGRAGGKGGKNASEVNDGGGNGGNGGSGQAANSTGRAGNGGGGGGSGGYLGPGGNGGAGIGALNVNIPGPVTTGGGTGGSGGGGSSGQTGSSDGGGVYLYGYHKTHSGRHGSYPSGQSIPGLTAYGGSGNKNGVVRIIWGRNRYFPDTNVGYM